LLFGGKISSPFLCFVLKGYSSSTFLFISANSSAKDSSLEKYTTTMFQLLVEGVYLAKLEEKPLEWVSEFA
jgi:hypothetical protein